jgi:hypothetical protein
MICEAWNVPQFIHGDITGGLCGVERLHCVTGGGYREALMPNYTWAAGPQGRRALASHEPAFVAQRKRLHPGYFVRFSQLRVPKHHQAAGLYSSYENRGLNSYGRCARFPPRTLLRLHRML